MMTRAIVTGHIPGNGRNIGVHRCAGLNALAEPFHCFRGFQVDHLDNVVADLLRHRISTVAQQFHDLGGKHRSFGGLCHRVRGQEEPLIKRTVVPQRSTAFPAIPGTVIRVAAHSTKSRRPATYPPIGAQAAAGFLMSDPIIKSAPTLRGLGSLHKFAIAVVY